MLSRQRKPSGLVWSLLSLAASVLGIPSRPALAQETYCSETTAEFITVQGGVDLRRANTPDWLPALVGHQVCPGDSVRTSFEGQALVRLADGTLLNLDAGTQSTFGEAEQSGKGTLVDLIRGIIHVISRDPRSLRFNTPYVNAGLEGTEFTIAVDDDSTEVTVIEGEVALENPLGSAHAPQGTRGIGRAASSPEVRVAESAMSAIAWTAYFPEIVPARSATAAIGRASSANDSAALAARAATRLRIGLPDLARSDLERSLALDARNPVAWSLLALIDVAAGDEAAGRNHVDEALASDPAAPSAHLARSYLEQRFGTLQTALAAALDASTDGASAAIVWERRAELLAATGEWSSARSAATQALAIDPNRARSLAVLGFIELGERRSERAADQFLAAVERDPALPLARLGLALAYTQMGSVEAGREQLEIAVSLDARDAQIRSYMAKGYATENRDALGSTLLQIAKQLDATDPTPWLYSARILQQENAGVAALWEYETALEKSDQQPLFRSSFTLDDDTAVRNMGVGNLYRSLRFDRLAVLEGSAALDTEPSDYAGHQLLADVNSLQPRLQMARVNEQFQAQLLRPIDLLPTHPHFGEANYFLVDVFGPSTLTTTDLLEPLSRDDTRVHISATTGSNATQGTELLVANTHDRVAVSAGILDFETDGFGGNNDFSQRVANALVKFQASTATHVLFEARTLDIDSGSLARYFDPNAVQLGDRTGLDIDTIRAGIRHTISPRHTLVGFLSNYAGNEAVNAPTFSSGSSLHGKVAEVQHLYSRGRWTTTSGIAVAARSSHGQLSFTFPDNPPPFGDSPTPDTPPSPDGELPPSDAPFPDAAGAIVVDSLLDDRRSAIYGYARYEISDAVSLVGGVEGADFRDAADDGRDWFPKLGLEWEVARHTRLRAAAFEGRQGPVINPFVLEPTLAPTYFAGFNQQYFATSGEEFRQRGLAVDHRRSERLFVGAELVQRDVKRPFTDLREQVPIEIASDIEERLDRVYLYWTASQLVAFAAEMQFEQFDNIGVGYFDNFKRLETRRLPITLSLFHRPRLSTQLRTTFVDQSGSFLDTRSPEPNTFVVGEDAFWIVDLAANYRLPRRRGTVSLVAANLFDKSFLYQDTDPRNPLVMPERMVSVRFTLAL